MARFASVTLRFFPVFLLTLFIGLGAAGLFADYRIRFYIEKDRSFSADEVERLMGKKVLIQLPNRSPENGTIVGTSYGQLEVCCTTIERRENAITIFGREELDVHVMVLD